MTSMLSPRLFAVALVAVLPVLADPPMTKLRIEVRKSTNDKPIERASVIVRFVQGRNPIKLGKRIMTSYQLKTNQEGVAAIPPIPQGKIQVQVIAKGQQTFGGLDVLTRRNAFGRQTESFEAELDIPALGTDPVHTTFIRGPVVEEVGADATALASLEDGRVVAVEQGNLLGISFHPELSGEPRFHQRFLVSDPKRRTTY